MARTADLHDARESLEYWETRHATLPRRAVRRRREAREMAARWRERVAAAEQARYGAGWLGILTILVAERRLPAIAHRHRRSVARTAHRAVLAMVVAATALAVLAGIAVIEVIAAVVRAL